MEECMKDSFRGAPGVPGGIRIGPKAAGDGAYDRLRILQKEEGLGEVRKLRTKNQKVRGQEKSFESLAKSRIRRGLAVPNLRILVLDGAKAEQIKKEEIRYSKELYDAADSSGPNRQQRLAEEPAQGDATPACVSGRVRVEGTCRVRAGEAAHLGAAEGSGENREREIRGRLDRREISRKRKRPRSARRLSSERQSFGQARRKRPRKKAVPQEQTRTGAPGNARRIDEIQAQHQRREKNLGRDPNATKQQPWGHSARTPM